MSRSCKFCNDYTKVYSNGQCVGSICEGAIECGYIELLTDREIEIGCNGWTVVDDEDEIDD